MSAPSARRRPRSGTHGDRAARMAAAGRVDQARARVPHRQRPPDGWRRPSRRARRRRRCGRSEVAARSSRRALRSWLQSSTRSAANRRATSAQNPSRRSALQPRLAAAAQRHHQVAQAVLQRAVLLHARAGERHGERRRRTRRRRPTTRVAGVTCGRPSSSRPIGAPGRHDRRHDGGRRAEPRRQLGRLDRQRRDQRARCRAPAPPPPAPRRSGRSATGRSTGRRGPSPRSAAAGRCPTRARAGPRPRRRGAETARACRAATSSARLVGGGQKTHDRHGRGGRVPMDTRILATVRGPIGRRSAEWLVRSRPPAVSRPSRKLNRLRRARGRNTSRFREPRLRHACRRLTR